MKSSKALRYLLDVNVLVALTSAVHVHHLLVKEWFNANLNLEWAICAFTEAGFVRTAIPPRPGQIEISEATTILSQLAQHPGYHYLPITADWYTLCSPFFKRLYGTKQITDAYLLGLAIREGLILVTLDRAILHLAGEHKKHVLLLTEPQAH
jgi:toxin-antitoxin system PIN domain toxin